MSVTLGTNTNRRVQNDLSSKAIIKMTTLLEQVLSLKGLETNGFLVATCLLDILRLFFRHGFPAKSNKTMI